MGWEILCRAQVFQHGAVQLGLQMPGVTKWKGNRQNPHSGEIQEKTPLDIAGQHYTPGV